MYTEKVKIKTLELPVLEKLLTLLPQRYRQAYNLLCEAEKNSLTEIRIRADMPCSFTACGRNIIMKSPENGCALRSDLREIEAIVYELCRGSVYSFSEHIKNGYIPFGGTRVGISGTAYTADGKILGFNKISSLNIRIPRYINAADEMLSHIAECGYENALGVIAISPPNCGKTTFLRALAAGLSDSKSVNPLRVCIIDERDELYCEKHYKGCFCDVISGVPKAKAVEIATRTLSPQLIVCDEIGNSAEARLLHMAHSSGIYLAASFHGEGLRELSGKEHFKALIQSGAFKTAYILERVGGSITGRIEKIADVNGGMS